jgi:hypothetical protein
MDQNWYAGKYFDKVISWRPGSIINDSLEGFTWRPTWQPGYFAGSLPGTIMGDSDDDILPDP